MRAPSSRSASVRVSGPWTRVTAHRVRVVRAVAGPGRRRRVRARRRVKWAGPARETVRDSQPADNTRHSIPVHRRNVLRIPGLGATFSLLALRLHTAGAGERDAWSLVRSTWGSQGGVADRQRGPAVAARSRGSGLLRPVHRGLRPAHDGSGRHRRRARPATPPIPSVPAGSVPLWSGRRPIPLFSPPGRLTP